MNTMNRQPFRQGFALPVALLAMMVIGAIVTGGFYAASQETRISSSTDLGSQAFYVAEHGLEQAMGEWKNAELDSILPDTAHHDFVSSPDTMDAVSVEVDGRTLGEYQLVVRRIGQQTFLLTSEGRVNAGTETAIRRVGSIMRTSSPTMPAPTSLAIYGGLEVGGNSKIKGNDNGGPGCTASDSVSGVAAYEDSLITGSNVDSIIGSPAVMEDKSLDTAGLSDFGDIDLDALKAAATKRYAPGESENGMAPATTTDADGNTICDTSVRSNWGDPSGTGPCGGEYPIIYAEGDLHLKTGQGQGILIVEGNLQASGNFDFYGVVIVLGEIKTTGTGNHFEGSVIVQGRGSLDSESTTLGNSLVQYSECRVKNAFDAALRPRRLAKRSWIDFSAATKAAGLVAAPSS